VVKLYDRPLPRFTRVIVYSMIAPGMDLGPEVPLIGSDSVVATLPICRIGSGFCSKQTSSTCQKSQVGPDPGANIVPVFDNQVFAVIGILTDRVAATSHPYTQASSRDCGIESGAGDRNGLVTGIAGTWGRAGGLPADQDAGN